MLKFMVDETNKDVGDDGFFIVGGLVFTDEQAIKTHQGIEEIRKKHGFLSTDKLKFQTKSRPKTMTAATQTAAKSDVIELLRSLEVPMITTIGLNAIVKANGDRNRMALALNTLTLSFLQYLDIKQEYGEIILDRDDSMIDHLRKIFQEQLLWRMPRDKIVLLGSTSDGLSHLSSAVDIALGGLRYCVNTKAETDRDKTVARALLSPLAKMLWGVERADGVRQIGGYGFNTTPRSVRVPAYKARYEELTERLAELSRSDAEPTVPTDASRST